MKTFSSGLESFCCDNKQLPTAPRCHNNCCDTKPNQTSGSAFRQRLPLKSSHSGKGWDVVAKQNDCSQEKTKEHWRAKMLRPPNTSRVLWHKIRVSACLSVCRGNKRLSDEEAKMRPMTRKELCCVLEKALAARNLLGPRGLGQCSSFYKQGNYLTKNHSNWNIFKI